MDRTLLVIRSSDGAAFSLSSNDFNNISTLEELKYNLLSPLLSIPPDCLILMNQHGIPLTRDDAVQQLKHLTNINNNHSTTTRSERGEGRKSTSEDQSGGSRNHSEERNTRGEEEHRVYVFDREHLDADPEEVAVGLKLDEEMVLNEPPLNPEDPLPSHLSLSLHNLTTLRALTSSITYQRSSLSLALSNLHRVNTGTSSSFRLYLETARPLLERYEGLLNGWEENMEAIKKVKIVQGLLVRGGNNVVATASSTVTGGQSQQPPQHQREGSTTKVGITASGEEKQRYLGDYVSSEKMMAVRDGCAKVLAELKMRTEALQVTLDDVMTNAEAVQADLEATSRDLEDLEACEQDAEHGHLRIEELVQAGESMTDPEIWAQCFEELSVCDAEHRDRIRFLIERKNAMTRYLLLQMQKISTLQSDIAPMPSDLGILDHDLRTRTENFKHLARLEGLIPAYVATTAEVVRRREYGRLVSDHSTSLATVLEPLTAMELERRRQYRSNYSGKLPWEVRGLSVGADEVVPEISFEVDERGIVGLPELGRATLDELRMSFQQLVGDLPVESPSTEATPPLHPLRQAKALLDTLIEKIDSLSKDFDRIQSNTLPPEPSIDRSQFALLESQVRQLEDTNESLSRQLQSERSSHEEAITKLENRVSTAESSLEREQRFVVKLEKDHEESERRVREKEDEIGRSKRNLEEERAMAKTIKKEIETLKMDSERLKRLVKEKETALQEAEETLEQLSTRLAEKDREVREVRSEAELDRALLEKELDEVRKVVDAKERDLERGQGRNSTLEEIAEGLRVQVARWETVAQAKDEEIEAARREQEAAKYDKEKGIVDVQKELLQAQRQARSAVIIAAKLRDENDNITRALNTPAPRKTDPSSTTELDRAAQPTSPVIEPPITPALVVPSLDYTSCDIDELLRELEQVSHAPLTEAIRNKMDGMTTLTKKWVKEAKAYRERAHRAASGASDKIAFRHFAKGDLALFLPTRNSTVPVWAAFNVSFPHHFLSPTGVIAEQMKTREWIVARITSLSETVVDSKDPSTNPYLLAAGTKFFLLEVEPWSSKESSRARKHSADKEKEKDKNKPADRRVSSSAHIRPSRSSSEAVAPTRSVSSTADSAILVDRPVSASVPNIRRTLSEGLPPNSTATARSDYAIVEVEEPIQESDSRPHSPTTLRQNVPRSNDLYDSPSASPSGLTRALARSQPATPTQQRPDPFIPSSASPNPFQISSSPIVGSPLRQGVSPPTTDYDPSHTSTGASPAFLPSSSRKTYSSNSASTSTSTHSPRYIRPNSTTSRGGDSKGVAISSGRPNPSPNHLSSSPASSSANSIRLLGQPRSASSGSSILSSSMHRRAVSTSLQGVSPPMSGTKSAPTNEAQLTDSRWNLLHDGLVDVETSPMTSTVPIQSKSPEAADSSISPESIRQSLTGGGGRLASSASTSSVFDMLTGKNRLTGGAETPGDTSSVSSKSKSKGGKGRAKPTGSAEGEIRKLLGQPPF